MKEMYGIIRCILMEASYQNVDDAFFAEE